ncbi:hypothetical protein FM038_008840 [Shewanella eurypsychrophilus]|uniref:Uncharacterized protein n=1 Tax=Shewanella eurypsychrophilus TaxID=2593656 RepID=A0ABX6VAL5_9GAMM|nr:MULTISPECIES: hypothetical protein [Shewanella]QFU22251.1 hypothetical protein FS418_10420 [Shewanella sp. YLB-09]QPG57537.1 hypothetical protein FM038_008840 [Shewanella eurypsychrophilus]
MNNILLKLQEYKQKNGLEHTQYTIKYDNQQAIQSISFRLSLLLGKISFKRDIAKQEITVKDGQFIMYLLSFWLIATGVWLSMKVDVETLHRLSAGLANITLGLVALVLSITREIKINALKRFLFE